MIAEPPSEVGALQPSETLPLPAEAEFSVGAPGAVAGADGVAERSPEREPSPTEFTAVTWYQYVVPFEALPSVQPVTAPRLA